MFQFRRSQRNAPSDKSGLTETQASADAKFEAIRERFIARVRDDYPILVWHRPNVSSRPPELVSTVHRLAGSAGMVGFTELGAAAGRLDDALAEPETDASAALQDFLTVLEKTIAPAKNN